MKTTKELARELGLIRKRTLSSSSTSRRGFNSGSLAQAFKYLIVIDFESTCWQDAKFRTQEIIEFPAVLLNTFSGEVESEFHHYVQPQEQPTLSAFCTELTGITQSQIDEGIPINLCLKKFGYWLDKLYREKGVVCQGTRTDTNSPINTTCVTWSDWDLGVCLQYECKRKQLLKPPQLTSWIDLRATYRKFYDRKPNGLNGALQDLGIEFQGREHSGVDDARNTAKLAFRMIKDGCQMKVTKTLKTHERSVSCNPTMLQYVSKATRTTPPRNAKEKSNGLGSNTTTALGKSPKESLKTSTNLPKDSPYKIPVRTKTPEKSSCLKKQGPVTSIGSCYDSTCSDKGKAPKESLKSTSSARNLPKTSPSKIPVFRKTPEKSSCFNEQGSVTSICNCYDLTHDKGLEDVKASVHKKRKQFTPVKDKSKLNTNSPRRKIPRKFSPKKFTSADIYVDPDDFNDMEINTPGIVKSMEAKKGLSAQDTNIQIINNDNTGNLKKVPVKDSTKCFKLPNPVDKSCVQSTFKTPQSFIKPKPLIDSVVSKSRSFVTSTPAGGTNCKSGFNQSKIISPLTNQSASVAGFSDCVTPNTSCQSGTGFKTPYQTASFTGSNHQSGFSINNSNMKVTPPLCKCGRRSKRRMVQSPGQNMGRFFFSCAVRKRVGSKEGCDFFKWETSLNTQSMSHSSSVISKQFTPVIRGFQQMSGLPQRKSLGVRSMTTQKVYMR
ncbi:ERI1 exoribonuclease 2-like [Ruditapes philippinarum]|uniref:ERI1 exoribonuclease 2-like n=1 Tax=Ruditapes philippinarum TaxID=129788 RepID=UPI00295ACBF2|nr:ERI1 exoribonuclease 2-like [Ruditapes philippinarum]